MLTDIALKNLKPGLKAYKRSDGGGLFVLVQQWPQILADGVQNLRETKVPFRRSLSRGGIARGTGLA